MSDLVRTALTLRTIMIFLSPVLCTRSCTEYMSREMKEFTRISPDVTSGARRVANMPMMKWSPSDSTARTFPFARVFRSSTCSTGLSSLSSSTIHRMLPRESFKETEDEDAVSEEEEEEVEEEEEEEEEEAEDADADGESTTDKAVFFEAPSALSRLGCSCSSPSSLEASAQSFQRRASSCVSFGDSP